ncbi:MAG: hypothetical protein KBF65_20240, partial [Rubrivivax sp.]|nr:hypothetical protein [Rubrivivax sp.]
MKSSGDITRRLVRVRALRGVIASQRWARSRPAGTSATGQASRHERGQPEHRVVRAAIGEYSAMPAECH